MTDLSVADIVRMLWCIGIGICIGWFGCYVKYTRKRIREYEQADVDRMCDQMGISKTGPLP